MAEILLRVVDKINPAGGALDRMCMKAGDVVHLAPDGWTWGTAELVNPEWRIVKIPGADPATLVDMLATDNDAQGNVLRKRRRCFDLGPAWVAAALAAGQTIVLDTPTKRADFLALRKNKPALGAVVL